MREWFAATVSAHKAHRALAAGGVWADIDPMVAGRRRPRQIPATAIAVAYEGHVIDRLDAGKKPPPIEWLWILHVEDALDDDEIASILWPGDRRGRASVLNNTKSKREKAHEWWADRCAAMIATYERHGTPSARWPRWLRDR